MNRKLQILPWLAGAALVGVSLLGATKLISAEGESGSNPPPNPAPAGAVTALGTVASDPSESPVGPPAVAGIVNVSKVYVHDGQEVNAGDKLVQFDDSLVLPKVIQAKAGLAQAFEKSAQAEAQIKLHQIKIQGQELMIQTAKKEIARSQTSLELGRDTARRLAKTYTLPSGQPYSEAQQQAAVDDNLELRKAESELALARAKLAGEQKTLEGLKLVPVESQLREAQDAVAQYQGVLAEAEAAVAAYAVTARLKGAVEQVFAAPGMTYGPSTRVPLLYLVPTGKRIVRAEVEAEFVARVADKTGRPVTVVDANNFSLKYPGTVRRVGSAFFPKRSQADGFSLNTVKVVECIIDLGDTPAGTPPLLVGQPVRVTFQ